jgi:hypothetical protein
MELIYTNGCTAASLTVDGVESIDMEDFRKVIHMIVDKIEDISELQDIFKNFMELNGELTGEYTCLCCGDCVTIHKIKI